MILESYSYDDAFKACVQYFGGDELAAKVFLNKWALKGKNGELYEKTPDDMHKRLAREFARIESKYPNPLSEQEIYELLKDFKYNIPAGSPSSGIGNNIQVQSLSNCYVIGNKEDSYSSIMMIDEEQVHIMRRRGGVGHDLSHLRPNGTPTTCAANTSTGIVPFAERYSNTTREVAQDGRRGALMLSLDIKHPDAEEFIDSKLEKGKITGANISVKLSNEFIEKALKNEKFTQQFPIDSDNPIVKKEIKAKKLWDKIMFNAWKSAEPGLLFWDKILEESPARGYGEEYKEVSTNPCSEIGMSAYNSCILSCINLYSFVEEPFTSKAYFDFEKFQVISRKAFRLIDDIVDLEIEKIKAIIEKVKSDPEDEITKLREIAVWNKILNKISESRRVGLGITAEGDMIAALGLRYGTKEASKFQEEVHKQLAINVYTESINLAKERGCFSIWNYLKDTESNFLIRIFGVLNSDITSDWIKYGRRNIACLTIAPTGTTSLMTQTTSGIEPAFLISYKRRRKINPDNKESKVDFTDELGDKWEEYRVFHHKFIDWYYNSIFNRNIEDKYFLTRKQCQDYLETLDQESLTAITVKSPYYKATSEDIDWQEKVAAQGLVQKWVDHSISVTVNVPENTTVETVSKIYETAYRSGTKGCTIYREGSRSGVLISDKKTEPVLPKLRPKSVECDINHMNYKGKRYVILLGHVDNKPYEIFAFEYDLNKKYTKGKLTKIKSMTYDLEIEGDGIIYNIVKEFDNPLEGSLTRQISLNLKNSPIEDVYIQLQKEGNVSDYNKVLSRTLKKYLPTEIQLKSNCPTCGTKLKMTEGCVSCPNCGYSKC